MVELRLELDLGPGEMEKPVCEARRGPKSKIGSLCSLLLQYVYPCAPM